MVVSILSSRFYRIDFLNLPQTLDKISDPEKADILCGYELSQILQLRWNFREQFRSGTIKSYIEMIERSQLKNYVLSTDVQQRLEKENLGLGAYLVIIVGSRHILLWEMEKDGNLAQGPHLVELPSRSNRHGCRGQYS